MNYYHCEAERTNARCANENGDVESSNGHLKDRIDQALLLRGSRNFDSREEMFPTSIFRMTWDSLRAAHSEKVADKMYVQILHLAALENQDAVADVLRHLQTRRALWGILVIRDDLRSVLF